ncbi:Centrosomal protein of 131 kDa [Quaeritorhiza haematococci]|nr:Centrosomal protein of 131 kDa [Quaeritorhiza haematococci]
MPVDVTRSTNVTSGSLNTAAVFDGVKAKMMGQQLEIEEKTQTLNLLKKELKKLKEANKDQAAQHKKDLKSQLSLQRKEYETIIKRHLSFIDKLLAEKDDLSKKSEALAEEVKSLEKQFKEKAKTVEEANTRNLKQQRELWEASEKIKRDKWIQEKTKAIKEQTVKGLEPEIQRMLAQHKLQLRQLEEKLREELIKEKNILIEQHQRQMEQLRDRALAERQKACEEEREFGRQRYQKQLERDEMEFQQQKRKLVAELEEQKHALLESIKSERKLDEQTHRKGLDELRREIEKERQAKEEALEELSRKHNAELQSLRVRFAIEKEEWQAHYMAKQEMEIRNREKLFKEKLLKERDTEIEMVIQRLESETNSNASDITRRHRMEVEKLRAEMAEEVKQLRDQHNIALDKVLSLQNETARSEESRREVQKEVMKLQHELAAKENLLRQQKNELTRLKVDEETLKETIRCEFQDTLTNQSTHISTLTTNLANLQSQLDLLAHQHAADLDAVHKEKEVALQVVEDRVRKAMSVKEEVVTGLRRKVEELGVKNGMLEKLIEKQRQVRGFVVFALEAGERRVTEVPVTTFIP